MGKKITAGITATIMLGVGGAAVWGVATSFGRADEPASRRTLEDMGFEVKEYLGKQSPFWDCEGYSLRDGFKVADKNTGKEVIAIVCKAGFVNNTVGAKDKVLVRYPIE